MKNQKSNIGKLKSALLISAQLFAWAIPLLAVKPAAAASPILDLFLNLSTGSLIFGADALLRVVAWVILLLGGLSALIGKLANMLISNAIVPNADGSGGANSLLFSQPIATAWQSVLQGANVLLFLALGIMAIMIITGMQNYNLKKAVSGLVYSILMANFSYRIVLLLVAIGDLLRRALAAGLGTDKVMDLGTLWTKSWEGMFSFNIDSITSLKDSGAMLLSAFISVIIISVGAYAAWRIAWVLLERTARLAIYIVFAPLIFILQLFPGVGLDAITKNWWTDLIKWILVLPIIYFLLAVASLLMPDVNLVQAISNAALKPDEISAEFWTNILLSSGAIAVTLSAGNAPQLLKLAPGSPLGGPGKFLGSIPGRAGKFFGTQARNTATLAGQSIALGTGLAGGYERLKNILPKSAATRVQENRDRLKDIANAAKTARASDARPLLQAQYERARDAFIASNAQAYFGKSADDLSKIEKKILENDERFKNSGIARAYSANKKTLSGQSKPYQEKYEEDGLSAEEAREELELLQGILKRQTDKGQNTGETKAKINGLLKYVNKRAGQGGYASVPFKDLGTDIYFDKHADYADATAAAKSIGGSAPSKPYTATDKERRDYQSKQRGGALDDKNAIALADAAQAVASPIDIAAATAQIQQFKQDLEAKGNHIVADMIQNLADGNNKELADILSASQSQLEQMDDAGAIKKLGSDSKLVKKLSDIMSDGTLSQLQKKTAVSQTLGFDPNMRTLSAGDLDRLTSVITSTNGAVFGQIGNVGEIAQSLKDPNTSGSTKGMLSQIPIATSPSGAGAKLSNIAELVGRHPGFETRIASSSISDARRAEISDTALAAVRSSSTPIFLDRTSSKATDADKQTLTQLVQAGTITDADIAAEHQVIKDLGISKGVTGVEELDLSKEEDYRKLTNAQRRDLFTKVLFAGRTVANPGTQAASNQRRSNTRSNRRP